MNQELQLKLQAYLDGELPDGEAAEARELIARDGEAQALVAELANTSAALAGHEAEGKLPETREFYWSKIQREIARQEAPVAVSGRGGFGGGWAGGGGGAGGGVGGGGGGGGFFVRVLGGVLRE